METVTLPLNGDVETHGQVLGAGNAWEAIAEDPADGDTTRIRINAIEQTEASSVDGTTLPGADIRIQEVRIEWEAAGTAGDGGTFARVGLRIDGVDYWAPAILLDPHLYGGNPVSWTTNPATGLPWSPQAASAVVPLFQTTFQDADFGWPRLTQRIVKVDFIYAPDRLEASGEGHGQDATVTGHAQEAAGAGHAPGAAGQSNSQASSMTVSSPDAEASFSGPSASGSPRTGLRNTASIIGCRARPSAGAVRSSLASTAPAAVPSTNGQEGEAS